MPYVKGEMFNMLSSVASEAPTFASLDQLEISGDFNGTTSNLCGDTESLEEGCLARFHTSVSGRDVDIARSDSASTGRRRNSVRKDLVTGGLEVAVGEDEANVPFNVRQETFVLRVLIDESLERTSDHGVLAHQNHCFASEGLADFVHLLRGDIVNADDEDGLVLVEQALQLVEVHSLGSSLAPHDFLRMKLGCLRAKSNAIVRLKWSLCDETVPM